MIAESERERVEIRSEPGQGGKDSPPGLVPLCCGVPAEGEGSVEGAGVDRSSLGHGAGAGDVAGDRILGEEAADEHRPEPKGRGGAEEADGTPAHRRDRGQGAAVAYGVGNELAGEEGGGRWGFLGHVHGPAIGPASRSRHDELGWG